ncbi:MAG: fatty acid desaturase family protein [Neptuniibacter sp.]
MSKVEVPNKALKQLYIKNDLYAAVHVGLHLSLFLFFFAGSCYLIDKGDFLAAFICLIATGFLGNFLGWSGIGHELLHETVFSSRKLNRFLVRAFAIYLWNNWAYHQISHRIHHRSTMLTGVDFEFDPNQKHLERWDVFISVTFNYKFLGRALRNTLENAFGTVNGGFASLYILNNDENYRKVVSAARLILLAHFSIFLIAWAVDFVAISMVFSLSPFMCNLFSRILALSQHFGMEVDVNDPRRTSRSITIPRWLEFFYANMNYHVEHHIYAGIPFYNLPRARKLLEDQLPEALNLKDAIQLALNPPQKSTT